MTEKPVIRIEPELHNAIRLYAESNGITLSDAAEKILCTGLNRHLTVQKFEAKKRKSR